MSEFIQTEGDTLTLPRSSSESELELERIRRRVDEMECNWDVYGFPVDKTDADYVGLSPARKLFSRIIVLREKWEIYFNQASVVAPTIPLVSPGAYASIAQMKNMIYELQQKWSSHFAKAGRQKAIYRAPREEPEPEFDIRIAPIEKLKSTVTTVSSDDEVQGPSINSARSAKRKRKLTLSTSGKPTKKKVRFVDDQDQRNPKRSSRAATAANSTLNQKLKALALAMPLCSRCISCAYSSEHTFLQHLQECFSNEALQKSKQLNKAFQCLKCSSPVSAYKYINHFRNCDFILKSESELMAIHSRKLAATTAACSKQKETKTSPLPSCIKCSNFFYMNDAEFKKHLEECFGNLPSNELDHMYECIQCSSLVKARKYVHHFKGCTVKVVPNPMPELSQIRSGRSDATAISNPSIKITPLCSKCSEFQYTENVEFENHLKECFSPQEQLKYANNLYKCIKCPSPVKFINYIKHFRKCKVKVVLKCQHNWTVMDDLQRQANIEPSLRPLKPNPSQPQPKQRHQPQLIVNPTQRHQPSPSLPQHNNQPQPLNATQLSVPLISQIINLCSILVQVQPYLQ